jgi:transposase
MTHERKSGKQFTEFLRQLIEAKQGRKFVLVLDNAGYHLTRATLELLAEHEEQVRVFWLPTYSPELNAIEGLWGYVKHRALNNYFFGTIERLEKAVAEAFAALNSDPSTALSLAYNTSQNLCRTA